ncbi:hypothetical protein AMK18_01440 [Streptomyces sp. CB01249]|uniref:DUF3885 domain-containing protein n=1 Tax=Streptomyces sp. CB01249 TaxID=1703929 RepID=UPI00093F4EEA|nr:hypothetical protein [Streptomyces sp. CB01249]OKJ05133.1 hypothetical protein AMK18_01440 [Streptomyces sp. CB01249]
MSRIDLDALSKRWSRQWPPPEGDPRMCFAYADRWVRFHSLPESKRYADDEAEYAVILDRHHTLLGELGPDDEEVYVVTREWSGDLAPGARRPELRDADPDAEHWGSHVHDDDFPDDIVYEHEYVSRRPRTRHALDPLLRLVADDVVSGVTIAPLDLRWIYHPYDGGGDVVAPDGATRDALRAAHQSWLSAHPLGL